MASVGDKCAKCGVVGELPLFCRNCKATMYCSTVCQKAHWRAGHKRFCNQMAHEKQTTGANWWKRNQPAESASTSADRNSDDDAAEPQRESYAELEQLMAYMAVQKLDLKQQRQRQRHEASCAQSDADSKRRANLAAELRVHTRQPPVPKARSDMAKKKQLKARRQWKLTEGEAPISLTRTVATQVAVAKATNGCQTLNPDAPPRSGKRSCSAPQCWNRATAQDSGDMMWYCNGCFDGWM
jgi:hypothetical protein